VTVARTVTLPICAERASAALGAGAGREACAHTGRRARATAINQLESKHFAASVNRNEIIVDD
jgi:hypothetical protein